MAPCSSIRTILTPSRTAFFAPSWMYRCGGSDSEGPRGARHFSWARSVYNIHQIYMQVLGQKRGGLRLNSNTRKFGRSPGCCLVTRARVIRNGSFPEFDPSDVRLRDPFTHRPGISQNIDAARPPTPVPRYPRRTKNPPTSKSFGSSVAGEPS